MEKKRRGSHNPGAPAERLKRIQVLRREGKTFAQIDEAMKLGDRHGLMSWAVVQVLGAPDVRAIRLPRGAPGRPKKG